MRLLNSLGVCLTLQITVQILKSADPVKMTKNLWSTYTNTHTHTHSLVMVGSGADLGCRSGAAAVAGSKGGTLGGVLQCVCVSSV